MSGGYKPAQFEKNVASLINLVVFTTEPVYNDPRVQSPTQLPGNFWMIKIIFNVPVSYGVIKNGQVKKNIHKM